MLKEFKAKLQDKLYQECLEDYNNTLKYQKDPYLMWISNKEKGPKEAKKENYPSIAWIQMEKCDASFSLQEITNEYVLFTSKKGKIAENAFDVIEEYFTTHPEADILYPDEDIWMLLPQEEEALEDESTHRVFPWLKPVWSPDTLLSFQYFGNIFAVRRSAFSDCKWLGNEDYRKNVYDFLLQATQKAKSKEKILHMEQILFHAFEKGNTKEEIEDRVYHKTDLWGASKDYDSIKQKALERQGIKASFVSDDLFPVSYPVYTMEKEEKVSIVIPSKDHLDILKRCLTSVFEKTAYSNFEVIVVDNGSSAQTRMSLESFRRTYEFTYLYQPMEFNFSRMCNLGVEKATGTYILLLNDDMEVIEPMWLTKLVGQATLPHVGAVGAKLYYPNSRIIQHAGIYNTCSGPGHKLKKHEDDKCYYYARNKCIYDMIGVTAACLLMRKDRYIELGGLYEGLQVAYNDVDLCFRIHEKGWYLVQRNDVCLYHHESLSRGDDMIDPKKLERLMTELDVLYKRHPKLYRYDPFLGTLMNSGEDSIHCRWMELYEFYDTNVASAVTRGKHLPDKEKMNRSLYFYVDDCQKEELGSTYEQATPYYLLRGWVYVHDIDNAKYRFTLILENEAGETWEIPVERRYRRDVAAILPHETNVELAGFCCWLYEHTLPKGTYRLWIRANDRCSRQKLYADTQKDLVVLE